MAQIGELSIMLKLDGVKQVQRELEGISKQIGVVTDNLGAPIATATKEIDQGFKKANMSAAQFGRQLKAIGSDLRGIATAGRNFSGAIVGIFGASFNSARSALPQVDEDLKALKNSFTQMSISLAQAANPALKEFIGFMTKAANALKEVTATSPEFFSNMLKFAGITLVISQATIAVGQFLSAAGKLVSFLNRIGLLAGVFNPITLSVLGLVAAFVVLSDQLTTIGQKFQAFATGGFAGLGALFSSQGGGKSFSQTLTGLTKDWTSFLDKFKGASADTVSQTEDTFGRFFRGLQTGFKTLGEGLEEFARGIRQSMENTLGDSLFNLITGKAQDLKAVFKSLVDDILRQFTRLAANQLLNAIFGGSNSQGVTGIGGSGGLLGNLFGFLKGGFGKSGKDKAAEEAQKLAESFASTTENMGLFQEAKDVSIDKLNTLSAALDGATGALGSAGAGGAMAGPAGAAGAIAGGVAGGLGMEGIGIPPEALATATQYDALIMKINASFQGVIGSIQKMGQQFIQTMTSNVIAFGIAQVAMFAISAVALAASVAVGTAAAAALAAAWAPAALLASIATFGAAAAVGAAALAGAMGSLGGTLAIGKGAASLGGGGGGFATPGGREPTLSIGGMGGEGLPKFADGGIVSKPTVGLIGESGPEAVVPLNQLGGGGSTIVVNMTEPVFLDDEASKDNFIRKLSDALIRETVRRIGGTNIVMGS